MLVFAFLSWFVQQFGFCFVYIFPCILFYVKHFVSPLCERCNINKMHLLTITVFLGNTITLRYYCLSGEHLNTVFTNRQNTLFRHYWNLFQINSVQNYPFGVLLATYRILQHFSNVWISQSPLNSDSVRIEPNVVQMEPNFFFWHLTALDIILKVPLHGCLFLRSPLLPSRLFPS